MPCQHRDDGRGRCIDCDEAIPEPQLKKYTVTIRETAVYRVEVEVANRGEAEEAALAIFLDAEDTNTFFDHVEQRDADVTG
ncbi:hypothetical protein HU675_0038495 [Bradyrhizobium septentrionale]|uniref:hypothetical protein n=1 Tax=Bradyrhizobium septentrionale TaxID=1404411 RepID=UPI0015965B86|nr:hypothetical protein [Bradyrhizobium septentrionale]UGY23777.1 hypothetical protein HU675_0038495 [Bradyrhizobium septentrionale]